ncbi:uncharacterized protein Dwil_GK25191 [Drosophila willistoni]|uniref:Uncharacterized protein n=1 Tax=Drosophila willistoni TaxID=7260 RepID=B4NBU4_DROWI|nr:uncharacterized protein Dwil_GK25191 [Drosophila willistoni]
MSGLMIVGVPLSTGDKYIPRLTMRRIFNTKCFREERYRHEIANHYRDYKMQMQQHQHHLSHTMRTRSGHRHRQRHQKRQQRHLHHLQHQRRHKHRPEATASTFSGSLASQYSQFRGVWPTHVHYFPRFGDTYAPRGRQTICSGEPPDETYNAAVRLIKQAHSCEQLKELVQRQLWIYSCQRHRLRHREHVQQSQNAIADDDNDEDDHQQQQQQRRRIDFYTYLQLANGYYEQGLQANIKYLESIGKRNAIKTKQQQQQHQQQQHLRDTQQHHQNVADKLTMCDYFVKPSSSNLSATFDQCKFYEIIDNLSQLSLTNESNIDRLGATSVAAVSSLPVPSKSAVSQRQVDIKIDKKSNMEQATQQLTKKVLKLDLSGKNLDDYALKSPKSPIAARLPHQTSLTSSVDVEDRKTLREALYQGIFHRHRRTIFAVGSFLRMLRSRNAQYNTIRSSSEGEDIDEFLKRRSSKLLKLPHLFDR